MIFRSFQMRHLLTIPTLLISAMAGSMPILPKHIQLEVLSFVHIRELLVLAGRSHQYTEGFTKGDIGEAERRPNKWYPAKILNVNADGTRKILWTEESEHTKDFDGRFRVRECSSQAEPNQGVTDLSDHWGIAANETLSKYPEIWRVESTDINGNFPDDPDYADGSNMYCQLSGTADGNPMWKCVKSPRMPSGWPLTNMENITIRWLEAKNSWILGACINGRVPDDPWRFSGNIPYLVNHPKPVTLEARRNNSYGVTRTVECTNCDWSGDKQSLNNNMCPRCGSKVQDTTTYRFHPTTAEELSAYLEGWERAYENWLVRRSERISKKSKLGCKCTIM